MASKTPFEKALEQYDEAKETASLTGKVEDARRESAVRAKLIAAKDEEKEQAVQYAESEGYRRAAIAGTATHLEKQRRIAALEKRIAELEAATPEVIPHPNCGHGALGFEAWQSSGGGQCAVCLTEKIAELEKHLADSAGVGKTR